MSIQTVGVRINLVGSEPIIWRRVKVPVWMKLDQLHEIIQIAFDWESYHLWEFRIKGNVYQMISEYYEDDWREPAWGDRYIAEDFELMHFIRLGIRKFRYVYDFGDDWVHDISLGVVRKSNAADDYPILLGGERCAPPEDVGSIYGFEEFTVAALDLEHEEHNDVLRWYGKAVFEPDWFDWEGITRKFERIRVPRD